jgi:hypothetical protein
MAVQTGKTIIIWKVDILYKSDEIANHRDHRQITHKQMKQQRIIAPARFTE